YNGGASARLTYVLHRATGADIEEYAARHLFAPLGIERWFWKRTPAGLADTEGGLYLEPRDLAKLWYLVLKQGEWDGKQVLGRDWVRASVTAAVATGAVAGAPGYGLCGWLYELESDSSGRYWARSIFGRPL